MTEFRYDALPYYELAADLQPSPAEIGEEEIRVAHMINRGHGLKASIRKTQASSEPSPVERTWRDDEGYKEVISCILQAADFDGLRVDELVAQAVKRQGEAKKWAQAAANTKRGISVASQADVELTLTVNLWGNTMQIGISEGEDWQENLVASLRENLAGDALDGATVDANGVPVRFVVRGEQIFTCAGPSIPDATHGDQPTSS